LGVVHRDVKPGNVLFDNDGGVHLTDFGIARLTDVTAITATGLVIGTAAYLAPEQVTGDGASPASDIYALGLVLLEALTGERAYDGSPSEAAIARLHRQPEIPATSNRSLGALLGSMTAADPAVRPSAAGVSAALTASAEGVPTDATSVLPIVSDATVAVPVVAAPAATAATATAAPVAAPAPTRVPGGRRDLAGRLRVPLIVAAVIALLLIVGAAMSRDTVDVPANATATTTTAVPTTTAPAVAETTPVTEAPPPPEPAPRKGKKKGD
jgi:hypothetical protein